MKYLQNIGAQIITGVLLGAIFLLPFLGWPYSGHNPILFDDWTKKFLIVGIIWGVACGATLGLIPLIVESNISRRILIGTVVGGLSGMIFYLIGDLAFWTKDNLSTTFSKSSWGFVIGLIDGGLCASVVVIFYPLFKWVKVRDNNNDPAYQSERPQFRERLFSGLVGLNMGMIIGGSLILVFGLLKLATSGFFFHYEIAWFYVLPFVLGSAVALYAVVKPFPKSLVQKSIDGLRYGLIFSSLFILYFAILSFLILHSSLPKPEFMKDGLWLDFVPGVVVGFTTLFGLFAGITGATFEGFFQEWKAKHKAA